MTEIIKKEIELDNGTVILTYNKEIESLSTINFEAGTTGFKNGDSSSTYFKIYSDDCPIRVKRIPEIYEDEYDDDFDCNGFEVTIRGDAELESIIDGLKFITQVLEDGANNRNY